LYARTGADESGLDPSLRARPPLRVRVPGTAGAKPLTEPWFEDKHMTSSPDAMSPAGGAPLATSNSDPQITFVSPFFCRYTVLMSFRSSSLEPKFVSLFLSVYRAHVVSQACIPGA
jgi:hypothetical protein